MDLSALLRGHLEPGECCEIDGVGPIPVPMARDLANDSFLALVFHEAGDIKAVSHFGRTIKAVQRTALFDRDRTCVVPGCLIPYGWRSTMSSPLPKEARLHSRIWPCSAITITSSRPSRDGPSPGRTKDAPVSRVGSSNRPRLLGRNPTSASIGLDNECSNERR